MKVTCLKSMVPLERYGHIRNTYAKYERPVSYSKKVMANVEVLLMLIVVLHHIQRYFSYIVTGQMSSFQILTCCRAPTPWAARGL